MLDNARPAPTERLSYADALSKLEEHVGERCQFGLWAGDPPVLIDGVIEVRAQEVMWYSGELVRRTPPLDGTSSMFSIGGRMGPSFFLPPLPGVINERESGLDFELADGLTLRVAWPGPSGQAV